MSKQTQSTRGGAAASRPAPDPSLTEHDLLRAAEELVPLLRERAVETDASRGISQDTYRRLEDAGFIHMLMPRKYGGLELDDHANVMAILTLSSGCASTGWVVTVMSVGSILILSFPEEVHEEVWGEDTYATLAGNAIMNPNAKVERVKGGYRLSGSWFFGSGSDFAKWLIFNAPAGDNREPHMFLVPQHEAELKNDWDVTGLRGTNSQTMVVEDVFVPDRRVRTALEFRQGLENSRSLYPTFDALWNPFPSPARFPFSSAALGAALGAADHFAETIGSVTRVASALGGVAKLADQEYVATEFAEAQGELEMARNIVDLRSRQSSLRAAAHQLPTASELARDHRDSALVCRIALRSVTRIFALLGSKAGDPTHPVSIAKRDAEMASHHVGNNWRAAAVGWMSTAVLGQTPGSSRQ